MMGKINLILMVMIFFALSVISSFGQNSIYEWEDAYGNKHFSDSAPDDLKKDSEKTKQLEEERANREKLKAEKEKEAEKERSKYLSDNTQKILTNLRGNSRFKIYNDGVLEDKKTGLMWTLRNSYMDLYRPMTYREATWYVKGLKTGGYSDWRLPRVHELASFYCESPAFPAMGAEWFWSSQVYQRGKVDVCRIVKPDNFGEDYCNIKKCGIVHAVRP